jgi:hypothetical protein
MRERDGDVIDVVRMHYRQYLGTRRTARTYEFDGVLQSFDVVRFDRAPLRGATTFATEGLSHRQLRQADGSLIRHELLVSVRDDQRDSVDVLLAIVGQEVIDSGEALRRGDVIGPRGALVPGYKAEAFYCARPAYFPPEFEEIHGVPPTALVWLVPILHDEHQFLIEKGWPALEAAFEESDPDLMDLNRPGIDSLRRPNGIA